VAAVIERWIRVLLSPATEDGALLYRGEAKAGLLHFRLALRFDGYGPEGCDYTLAADAAPLWPGPAMDPQSAANWVDVWTSEFPGAGDAAPAPYGPGSAPYAALAEAALAAHGQPDSIEAVQGLIEERMKAGAVFSTAHKEGGTRLFWAAGRFRREDYGETSFRTAYADTPAFLAWLWESWDWSLKSAWITPPTALQSWQLLLRLLRDP
jgi:hypothetical protein